jgi:uncharacterized protein YbjT (DUF2867 family)
MRILVTGVTGAIGSALVGRLLADGHEVRGLARRPERATRAIPVVAGDAVTGAGLDEALDGVDLAYYLIHSMEPSLDSPFADRERQAAETFGAAARRAGVTRAIYLGGPVPTDGLPPSAHLASRLEVERVLLEMLPDSTALRASVVISADSRSFRLLVRLVERMPVLPLPAWSAHRTRPIDGRDVLEYLARAATAPDAAGHAYDVAGPDEVSYGELVERIRDLLILGRPPIELGFSATPIASRIAAMVAGEDHAFVGPLMESLAHELLPRNDAIRAIMPVRLHSLDAAIEHALAEWERLEPLAAR